jgi:hypothetical protein
MVVRRNSVTSSAILLFDVSEMSGEGIPEIALDGRLRLSRHASLQFNSSLLLLVVNLPQRLALTGELQVL